MKESTKLAVKQIAKGLAAGTALAFISNCVSSWAEREDQKFHNKYQELLEKERDQEFLEDKALI